MGAIIADMKNELTRIKRTYLAQCAALAAARSVPYDPSTTETRHAARAASDAAYTKAYRAEVARVKTLSDAQVEAECLAKEIAR